MNIFYLSEDPRTAAQLHCDKHVVKMILETAQILATVHHIHGNGSAVTYKATHTNHPCVRWAASCQAHYMWLQELGIELCREYQHRYSREHKCYGYLIGELRAPPVTEPVGGWSPPPTCMPDEFKVGSTVEAYQRYYRGAKATIARWTGRTTPQFMLSTT